VQVWKITIFDRQTALFNGASMGALTWGRIIGNQVEPLFINFSLSTAKKGYRKKPGSGNLEESLFKATISQRVPIPKSSANHIEKTNFLCVYPCLFWDRIWIRLRIRGRLLVVMKIFKKKISKIDEVMEGKIFLRFGL
jgi:hypothetical protein